MSKLITPKRYNAKAVKVIVPQSNKWHAKPSSVPSRFTSTTQPRRTSIVRSELNSISEPNRFKR